MGDEKSRSANFCSLPQSCSLRLRKGSGWQYDSRRELATYLFKGCYWSHPNDDKIRGVTDDMGGWMKGWSSAFTCWTVPRHSIDAGLTMSVFSPCDFN